MSLLCKRAVTNMSDQFDKLWHEHVTKRTRSWIYISRFQTFHGTQKTNKWLFKGCMYCWPRIFSDHSQKWCKTLQLSRKLPQLTFFLPRNLGQQCRPPFKSTAASRTKIFRNFANPASRYENLVESHQPTLTASLRHSRSRFIANDFVRSRIFCFFDSKTKGKSISRQNCLVVPKSEDSFFNAQFYFAWFYRVTFTTPQKVFNPKFSSSMEAKKELCDVVQRYRRSNTN